MTTLRVNNVLPVVNAPATKNANQNEWIQLSTFITVADTDLDPMVKFELIDGNNAAGSGVIWANNALQPQGTTVVATTGNLADLYVRGGANAGTDAITIRAHDGFGYGNPVSFNLVTRAPNRAPVTTPTAATQNIAVGADVLASTLFAYSDLDNDPAVKYEFWDGGSAATSGHFTLNGATQAANQAITVTPDQVTNGIFRYVAGTVAGSETLFVRAFDGSVFGDWKEWQMVTQRASNALPVITGPGTKNASQNEWVQLSTFLSVTDENLDPMVKFEIIDDNNTAGSGVVWANAAIQPQGSTTVANTGNLADLYVRGGANAGTDQIRIRANDGFGYGQTFTFNLVTRAPNVAPVAIPAAAIQNVAVNAEALASTLFTYSDTNNDPPVKYEFWDGGSASTSGRFTLNGQTQPANQAIAVTQDQLAQFKYVGGSVAGTETVFVRPHDGLVFGAWAEWQMTSVRANNAAPVVATPSQYILGVNEWIDAKLLQGIKVTDADGDATAQGRIVDDSATAGSAFIWYKGATIPAGQVVTFTQADLDAGNLWIRGGANAGTDPLRIAYSDGTAFSNFATFNVLTRATNQAPVVNAVDGNIGLNASRAVSTLFSFTDANSDAAQIYQFWDDGTAANSGRFTLGGSAQGQGVAITVLGSELAQAAYKGGSVTGSETVFARVFDGGAWSAWKSWQMTTTLGA
jgi:hypothetical protein